MSNGTVTTVTTHHHAATNAEASGATPPGRARTVARVTGLAYLGIIATGVFAEFAVRGSLVVDDDPIETAANIAGSPSLFGAGVGADVAMVAFDAIVAFGLFRLLRHVDRRLALTATVLRLIQGAVIAVNLLVLVSALDHAQDAVTADGSVLPVPAQEALDAIERHALGYDIGLIAFGLSCLAVGRLLQVSRLVPRLLAFGMYATGTVYLVGSIAAAFAPDLSTVIDPFYGIALATELWFALLLITKGLRAPATALPRPTPTTTAA